MAVPLTLSQRSRAARRAVAPARPHVPDPCPRCATDLGGAGTVTHRIALSSPTPGAFLWECPACRTRWSEPGRARRT